MKQLEPCAGHDPEDRNMVTMIDPLAVRDLLQRACHMLDDAGEFDIAAITSHALTLIVQRYDLEDEGDRIS